MKIQQHAFSRMADLPQMAALSYAFPADHLHVVDQPYRFSSWALDDLANARLWIDKQGRVVAWVVMQTPFWAIDYACHPDVADDVHPQLLAWAAQRAQQLVGSDFGRPMWFVNVFTDQPVRIRDLEAAGFYSVADVGENSWTKVLMQQLNAHRRIQSYAARRLCDSPIGRAWPRWPLMSIYTRLSLKVAA